MIEVTEGFVLNELVKFGNAITINEMRASKQMKLSTFANMFVELNVE